MRRDQEFSEFFAARGPALRRTAYLILRDWHLAEDVTQQAFAKVYVAWPRIRRETRDAYARKAVVNTALSQARRRSERPVADPPDTLVAAPADPALDIAHALGLLPERQRAIVALRFLDDQPIAEVARILGVAEGTVKSQTARALDTLRTHLPELVPEFTTEESR
jgi:RNA polymerase sigma-70 factor (sigma-E family)